MYLPFQHPNSNTAPRSSTGIDTLTAEINLMASQMIGDRCKSAQPENSGGCLGGEHGEWVGEQGEIAGTDDCVGNRDEHGEDGDEDVEDDGAGDGGDRCGWAEGFGVDCICN